MSIAPSQTIYASNLNDKVKKQELKKNLYSLFTTYGRVIDVVALKTARARGQAFIVFADISSATAALRALQKFNFLGKEMKLNYSKSTSNIIKRLDGSYKTEPVAPITSSIQSVTTAEKRPADDSEELDESNHIFTLFTDVSGSHKRFQGEEEENEPHRVLYVENLPLGVSDEVVAYLFQQYSGFKEVRMVPGRPDLAFVEFELAQQAAIAKEILNGFKVTAEHPMKITFAKK